MKQITVHFKRGESPTKIVINGNGYDYAVEDSVLEVDSDIAEEPDYAFNWSEVLYVESRITS